LRKTHGPSTGPWASLTATIENQDVDKTTGAMQEFGSTPAHGGVGADTAPGLVLLYAQEYERLPAAWPLRRRQVVIGSDETADIVVPVRAVSRRHVELSRRGAHWMLRDLGSRNGTLLDGRVVSEAVLEPLHEIRIGDAILKFLDRDAEAMAGCRIDGLLVDRTGRAGTHAWENSALIGGWQMHRIRSEIRRIANTDLTVMLLGESGTGKEVVARELHRLGGRRGMFCAVNCAAIPATLIESELFGFKRGAFSGAERDKPGLVRTAHEGTLLLDEIGDMPLEAQAKLLRVVQSREVWPLGATSPESVNVRVVCATHRDLRRLQREGRFREDLYARLNEYQVLLPPLRERKEDLYMLVRAFLARHGRLDLEVSFPFMLGLLHYDWPHNVRELESCIKRSVALTQSSVLGEADLPDSVRREMADYGRSWNDPPAFDTSDVGSAVPGSAPAPARPRQELPSEEQLRATLTRHRGNVAAVGRELGKARMQVHRWMRRYGIKIDDYR